MRTAELRRTAIHEAGHAVLSHFLGIGLRRVTIIAESDSVGRSTDGGEWPEDEDAATLRMFAPEAFWTRMAIIRYAGAEAVRRWSPRSRWKDGAESDYNWAAIALEKITDDLECRRALHAYATRPIAGRELLARNQAARLGAADTEKPRG